MGTPIGYEAVASIRSTLLEDCIKDVDKVFQSPPPTKNAGGFTNPTIEKDPSAAIAPCMNQEQCPMLPSGATDSTNRKDYYRFSQCYERAPPSYL